MNLYPKLITFWSTDPGVFSAQQLSYDSTRRGAAVAGQSRLWGSRSASQWQRLSFSGASWLALVTEFNCVLREREQQGRSTAMLL